MQAFAERLQKRTHELGLSHVEVARRADLAPRRYANYVRGEREPDLATLVKIARVLATTPNVLLGFGEGEDLDGTADLMARLTSSAKVLHDAELEGVVIQIEALAKRRLK